jgi:hypothetical protein
MGATQPTARRIFHPIFAFVFLPVANSLHLIFSVAHRSIPFHSSCAARPNTGSLFHLLLLFLSFVLLILNQNCSATKVADYFLGARRRRADDGKTGGGRKRGHIASGNFPHNRSLLCSK